MTHFVWDNPKEFENFLKHGVDFETAQLVLCQELNVGLRI